MFFGFTAIQSFIVIVLIFAITYWIIPKKLNWISFLLTTVLLSVLAFKIQPNISDDLYRYFMQLDYLRDYGYDYLQRCFEEGINSWDTYRVCGYYFYYISKLNDNHYLAAISIFIVYGLMFLIIYQTAKRFDAAKFDTFLGSMFFISTYWYYDTASGIRNGIAFAVVIACAYYHLFLKKHIPLCILGYVLACLMHSAAIMPVVFVVIAVATLNNSGRFINFVTLFGIAGGGFGIYLLADAFPDNSFLQSIAGKVEANSSGDTIYTDVVFLTNIATVIVCVVIILYYSYYLLSNKKDIDFRLFYKYSSIIMFFVVGSLYSVLIFMRFSRWIVPIIAAIFIIAGRASQSQNISENSFVFLNYNSPINVRLRFKLRNFVMLFLCSYTVVHFWYLCAGSSLNWMRFADEL